MKIGFVSIIYNWFFNLVILLNIHWCGFPCFGLAIILRENCFRTAQAWLSPFYLAGTDFELELFKKGLGFGTAQGQ